MVKPDYYSRPEISQSELSWFEKSPAYYYARKNGLIEEERQEYFDIGSALDVWITEGWDKFHQGFTVEPPKDQWPLPDNMRTKKENKDFLEAWEAENSHKTILKAQQWEDIHRMYEAIQDNKWAQEYISEMTNFQHEIYWTCDETGLRLKGRLDMCKPKELRIIDLKTTYDIHKFESSYRAFRYYRQAAYYTDGLIAQGQHMPCLPDYKLIVVSTNRPFEVDIFSPSISDLEYGRKEYKRLLSQLQWHIENDSWMPKSWYEPNGVRELDVFGEREKLKL